MLLGLEGVGMVGALRRPLMGGIEKVGAFDPTRFIDQEAQRLTGAIQAVGQQGGNSGLQGMTFYALCHGVGFFVGRRKNARRNRLRAYLPGALRALIAAAGKE